MPARTGAASRFGRSSAAVDVLATRPPIVCGRKTPGAGTAQEASTASATLAWAAPSAPKSTAAAAGGRPRPRGAARRSTFEPLQLRPQPRDLARGRAGRRGARAAQGSPAGSQRRDGGRGERSPRARPAGRRARPRRTAVRGRRRSRPRRPPPSAAVTASAASGRRPAASAAATMDPRRCRRSAAPRAGPIGSRPRARPAASSARPPQHAATPEDGTSGRLTAPRIAARPCAAQGGQTVCAAAQGARTLEWARLKSECCRTLGTAV